MCECCVKRRLHQNQFKLNSHQILNSFKLYLPTDLTSSLQDSNLTLSQKQQLFGTKLDFKNNCLGAGGSSSGGSASTTGGQNLCISSSSPDSQQFNIFPAIFSRQLNFSTGSCGQGKLMDELRPNLVGGLLGLQQGLLDDHALSHGNLQHSNQDTKFMSLQDNRLMGISSHENRLLGLASQDHRSSVGNNGDNKNSGQRKCSSTPEDFSALYGGLSTSGIGDTSSHHHTPAHTPPSRLVDHSITGKWIIKFLRVVHFLKVPFPKVAAEFPGFLFCS